MSLLQYWSYTLNTLLLAAGHYAAGATWYWLRWLALMASQMLAAE